MYEAFYKNYESEVFTVTILVKENLGIGHIGGYGNFSCKILAMVLPDGTLIDNELTLNWPVDWENAPQSETFDRLKALHAYEVEVSKYLIDPDAMDESRQEHFSKHYCLHKVLKSDIEHSALQAIKEEFLREVAINDPMLGKIVLDKNMGNFVSEVDWCAGQDNASEVQLYLDVDEDNVDACTQSLSHAHTMFQAQEKFDRLMREYAAKSLLEDANAWIADDDEQSQLYPNGLSLEDFMKRIRLSELSIDSDGAICAYYDDDDIFWGHVIIVEGTIPNLTFERAYIAG